MPARWQQGESRPTFKHFWFSHPTKPTKEKPKELKFGKCYEKKLKK